MIARIILGVSQTCFSFDFSGRLVFLGKGGDGDQASNVELKGAGYYWKQGSRMRVGKGFIVGKPF